MGIRNVYAMVAGAISDIAPKSYAGHTFTPVDIAASGPLEMSARPHGRAFDVGAAGLPVDDGEAGASDLGTLRLSVEAVLRVAYLNPKGNDRRALDVQLAEDSNSIRTALMTPSNWASASEVVSIEPPGLPIPTQTDDVLIITTPFRIIYREV